MAQRVVHDVSQRATRDYEPPSHAWGETWPGPAIKAMRQLTLLDLKRPKAIAKHRVGVSTGRSRTSGVCKIR